jgi:hypothetical protein
MNLMLSFVNFNYWHKTKNKGTYLKYKKITCEKMEDQIFNFNLIYLKKMYMQKLK